MAPPFRLSRQAVADLDNIWQYIAADSPESADRVQDAILAACARVGKRPLLGSTRPGLKCSPRLRFWTVPRYSNYLLAYYPDAKPLQVVAVLHGMRDVRRILRQRGES